MRRCRAAGITVRMVTGDHVGTATAIARQVEILPPADATAVEAGAATAGVTTAPVFDQLSRERLDALPALPRVVARCAPATKAGAVVVVGGGCSWCWCGCGWWWWWWCVAEAAASYLFVHYGPARPTPFIDLAHAFCFFFIHIYHHRHAVPSLFRRR